MEEEKFLEKNLLENLKKVKKRFYFQKWGLSLKDFKKWGKLGGRPKKYVSASERQKAYRRRIIQKRIASGEIKGILNLTTGRISKLKKRGLSDEING